MSEETAVGSHLNLWTRLNVFSLGWMWPHNPAILTYPDTGFINCEGEWQDCGP